MIPLSGRTRSFVDPGVGSIVDGSALNIKPAINPDGRFPVRDTSLPQPGTIQLSGRTRIGIIAPLRQISAALIAALSAPVAIVRVQGPSAKPLLSVELGDRAFQNPVAEGPADMTIGSLARASLLAKRRTVALRTPAQPVTNS